MLSGVHAGDQGPPCVYATDAAIQVLLADLQDFPCALMKASGLLQHSLLWRKQAKHTNSDIQLPVTFRI